VAGLPPNQQRPTEPNEFPLTGPFGGIQSQAPVERIELLGFADAVNVLFRNGIAQHRPKLYTSIPALDGPVLGAADFFDTAGVRHQVVMTPTSLYQWDIGSQTFVKVTGTLTGASDQIYSWSVVNNKLLFSQGTDKVQMWDGSSPTFGPVAASAVPARFLFELNFHLLAGYTTEAGPTVAPQNVRWTAANDPTDWTGFNAGLISLDNDLGPITGAVRVYQTGYIFQYWGITQVIPTGIGTAPFDFIPLGSKSKGNVIPYSLASFGEDMCCYVGRNNIYQFDGNYSTPIGDRPIDGSRYRSGARKRILADLQFCNFNEVFGFLTTSINGQDYFSYWLFMPQLNQAWVYHFDEGSWTRETFNATPSIAGNFFKENIPRIMDLVGTIAQQQWSPSELTAGTPFDDMLVGLTNGVPAYIDMTGTSEVDWSITSGKGFFGDFRHKKTVKAVRLVFEDVAPNMQYSLRLSNNSGVSQTQQVGPIGSGSGTTLVVVVPFQPVISGTHIDWILSSAAQGGATQPINLTEITPIYDVGGDIRVGDNA